MCEGSFLLGRFLFFFFEGNGGRGGGGGRNDEEGKGFRMFFRGGFFLTLCGCVEMIILFRLKPEGGPGGGGSRGVRFRGSFCGIRDRCGWMRFRTVGGGGLGRWS